MMLAEPEPRAPDRMAQLSQWLVLFLLAVLAWRQVGSPDAGFHLATGRSILAGHGIPRTDPFTYTVSDHPYIDTSWGYDLLLALIEAWLGVGGMVLFHAALVVATFALVARTAGLIVHDGRSLAVLLLLAGVMSEERFEVRPEIASYLLFAVVLHVLERRAAGRRTPLWALVPLFAIWANTHSLFVVGFGALACFNLGAWLAARRLDRRLLGWSAASVLATLLNPYGVRGLAMSLVLATRLRAGHVFHEHIGEYESPFETLFSAELGFYLLPLSFLFAFSVLVLLSILPLWRQRRWANLLLVLLFAPLALAMVRNAPLLAIACLPGTTWALPLKSLRIAAPARARIEQGILAAVAVFAVGLGLRVYHDAYYVGRGRLERFGWEWNRYRLPVDAAAYVRRVALPDPMLNDLNFGGHLIWELGRPVFIDGRLEVMGEDFFDYYRATFSSVAALEACVSRYGVRWIIIPYRDRPGVLEMLSADPRWRLVYVDHLAVIFVRADAFADSLLEPSAQQAAAPVAPPDLAGLPGLGAVERPGRLRRWLAGFGRRQAYPVTAYSLGVFRYLRGDWAGLASYSAAAIRESRGAFHEHYMNLGSALYALGHLDGARRCLAIAVAEIPAYRGEQRQSLRDLLRQIDRQLGPRTGD